MTATTTRSTPSLVVPSTQNTAPVLDFRCLYTYDLRRKAKRWQDGLARFHTFNKRVMVYDEPRNFIGDTHWREPEPIQDGDELQLDKGILIQIGEATGRIDQDISGLFEKRKVAPIGDEGSSPARTRPAQAPIQSAVRALQAAPSQLMPRTLNSVLGTPKGQIGRATLPAKSPFELRHASGAENEVEGRASKRQRISYPDPRGTPSTASSPAPQLHAPSKEKSLQARSGSPEIERNENSKNREELAARAKKAPKKDRKETIVSRPQRQQHSEKTPKAHNAPKERNIAPAMKKAPAPAVRSQCRDIDPSEVISIDSSGTQGPDEEQTSQGSRLRIVSSKPRKKLMYRDLLPQAKQTREIRIIPFNKAASPDKKKSTEKSVVQDIDPLSQFHHEERDRLKARLEKHGRKRAPVIQDADDTEIVDELSLFVSQDESALVPTVGKIEKEHMAVAAQRALQSQRQNDAVQECVDDGIPSSIEEIQPPASPSTTLAKMDVILLRRPKPPPLDIPSPKLMIPPTPTLKPVPQSNPIPKAPAPPPPVIPLAPAPQPPPPQPPLIAKPLQRSLSTVISATTTTAQQSKRSLRKTVSDTAALASGARRISANAERTLPPASVEAAPDPWSNEAWELFGCRREDVVSRATEEIEARPRG